MNTCGSHFLSWAPTLQLKYKKYAFFTVGVIKHFLQANITSLQKIAEVIRVIYTFPGYFHKYTTQSITTSWNYHNTILMKELGDTIYNMLALIQHLIRIEESWQPTILLITWRTPAVTIADHVISLWYKNYSARLECCKLLKMET